MGNKSLAGFELDELSAIAWDPVSPGAMSASGRGKTFVGVPTRLVWDYHKDDEVRQYALLDLTSVSKEQPNHTIRLPIGPEQVYELAIVSREVV